MAKRVAKKVDCPRCSGTGVYTGYGVCYRCRGAGKVNPSPKRAVKASPFANETEEERDARMLKVLGPEDFKVWKARAASAWQDD